MSDLLRVLLVTTWDEACGIAEHSGMLREAVERADAHISVWPHREALDPLHHSVRSLVHDSATAQVHVVHLNYQAALHSRWTPLRIAELQEAGYKVVVTYHDTGVPNSDQCKGIIEQADAAVVHEPFDDLPHEKTHYWRMGVAPWISPLQLLPGADVRPILGTIGFPFPWKNYTELVRTAAAQGWTSLLIAPGATEAQVEEWTAIDPHMHIYPDFLARAYAQSLLAACDATAFTYVCHNTGQSGAILMGVATRKPVFALSTCRQFRALFENPLGYDAIRWCQTFEDLAYHLRLTSITRCDPLTVALAHQESWVQLGVKYAQLYREVVGW
jgi:hypothetical protein